jgi:LysM repeat protein
MKVSTMGAGTSVPRPLLVAVVCVCLLAGCQLDPKPGNTASTDPAAVGIGSASPPIRYMVIAGDTLTAIAARFHVPATAIAATNHLGPLGAVTPGQVLAIPPIAPATLTIRPGRGTAGDTFAFALTGAKPGEMVLFEILHPDGTKFIGSAHTAGSDGSVTASYSTAFDARVGSYKVLAAGNQGTVVHTIFLVDSPPANSPTP